jgi:predicted nucleic acid-binding protein
LELGHQDILLDERDGRLAAKALGLQPVGVGVLGVLLRAKRGGLVATVRNVMRDLREHQVGTFRVFLVWTRNRPKQCRGWHFLINPCYTRVV